MVCHQQQLQRFDNDNVNLTTQLRESTPPLIIRQRKSTPPLIKQQRKSTPPLIEQQHLLGVFSSYLKNQKSFSSQTKATGKLTQLSTTFMFTPKPSSKWKRVKKTQEHETGDAAIVQLSGKTHFSPQISNFDFPMSKFDSKTCLTISIHDKALKII
ncbi:hypothetical protein MTR_4g028850 [Medicago truncatula]|uniref:Uncharacterized protein n=1 Tax=Medicago truncatula TaxID=3880 RepID=A0A072UJB8_MEDTR|nr:hypothetical protein MTR_4g028850 [Medicago truncatula]